MENKKSGVTEILVKMEGRKIVAVCPDGAEEAIIGMCGIIKGLLREVKWRTYRDLDQLGALVVGLESKVQSLHSDEEEE